jgi:hypothetical protein
MQVFLAEKRFEGCNGVEVTDEMRVLVAAMACLLILHIDVDYFPRMRSVLIYPEAFVVPHKQRNPGGIVSEFMDVRVGESWSVGTVILCWPEVARDLNISRGRNVVFHEFAHQIDQANGAADGWPAAVDADLAELWGEVMRRAYDALTAAVDHGLPTLIDAYGAKSPAEFFAVVTEYFFAQPAALREQHPDLYEVFARFYKQNPTSRFDRCVIVPS